MPKITIRAIHYRDGLTDGHTPTLIIESLRFKKLYDCVYHFSLQGAYFWQRNDGPTKPASTGPGGQARSHGRVHGKYKKYVEPDCC